MDSKKSPLIHTTFLQAKMHIYEVKSFKLNNRKKKGETEKGEVFGIYFKSC